MDQKYARRTTDFPLTDQASIEAYPIRGANTDAENCRFVVYGDASCADPIFHFAARSDAGTGKDLLKAFAFIAPLAPPFAPITPLWRRFTAVLLLLGFLPRWRGVVIPFLSRLAPLLHRRTAAPASRRCLSFALRRRLWSVGARLLVARSAVSGLAVSGRAFAFAATTFTFARTCPRTVVIAARWTLGASPTRARLSSPRS